MGYYAMTVYVPNRRPDHDYTSAGAYGEIVFLTTGPVRRTDFAGNTRTIRHRLGQSRPSDYIAVGSLSVLTSIAAAAFTARHGRLNLLLFEQGRYIPARHLPLTD